MKQALKTLMAAFALSTAAVFAGATLATAEVRIEVNKGVVEPLPIAVTDFQGDLGSEIAKIVTADLNSYWRFQADHLTRIPSVQSVKTDVPMETVKRSYAIPLP